MTITPMIKPALRALNPFNPGMILLRIGVMKVSATYPYTTVGTPASSSMIGRKILPTYGDE